MSNNFTFKLDPKPTGLMAVTDRQTCKIKLGGKECGSIYYAQGYYRIKLFIKDQNCSGFRVMTLKYTGPDINACKSFIKRASNALKEKYQIHCFEEFV